MKFWKFFLHSWYQFYRAFRWYFACFDIFISFWQTKGFWLGVDTNLLQTVFEFLDFDTSKTTLFCIFPLLFFTFMKAWLNGFHGKGDDLANFFTAKCPHSPITSGLFWRRGGSQHRKKLMYKTFYQRPVFRNQWSTFDAFTVMDCSQVGEKWHFFTSQVSTDGYLYQFSLFNLITIKKPFAIK